MKKYIVLIIILFSLMYGIVNALEITIKGYDDSSPGDWYHFDTFKNLNIQVSLIDKLSQEYINGKRIEIFQNYDSGDNGNDSYNTVGTGVLTSELYGDFYLKYGKIELLNDNVVNSNCNDVSYSFSGKLYSPGFGELDIEPGSYYCPKSSKSKINLSSALLGNITISGTEPINTIQVQNSRGQNVMVNVNNIFDDKKISVNGINNIKNRSGLSSDYSGENGGTIYTKNIKLEFKKNISRNLVKYTKGINPKINTYKLTSLDYTKKIFYYDYEGQEESTASNLNNKGKILTLGDGATETDVVMGVYGQQLIYVKGGNLYIDTDILNSNKKSQLVIVVKRDSSNRKNGGNVYIDPDVTNIDATIIADGSIISYNGTHILNSDDNTNSLRKQLLIYGSLVTKNTYGDDKAIYGTDDYINNGGKESLNVKTYNLAKLRSFQVILNNDVSGSCAFPIGSVVAKGDTGTGAIKYAFAGKKECFITESTYAGLRSTEKITSLVIEYNPITQKEPHFILRK